MHYEPTFYYADGERIPLDPTDQVAVDLETAKAVDLPSTVTREIQGTGRPLRGAIVMVARDAVVASVADLLDEAGALHPVFVAADDTLLVVLPEVRVEVADSEAATEVRQYLEAGSVPAEVVEDKGNWLTVRPTTGRGADALELANRIAEDLHPLTAQARFLRIVPKPGVEQKKTKAAPSRTHPQPSHIE